MLEINDELQTTLEITKIGEPVLRERAKEVEDIDSVRELCKNMISTLRTTSGVGIAAPQVGKSLRIFVVEVKKEQDDIEKMLYVVINPKITYKSQEKEEDWEGCLSIPELRGLVPRHKKIKMEYLTIDGEGKEEDFEGKLARIMQHEYDHLDGIVYLDRMESMKKLSTVENYKKYEIRIDDN